MQKIMNGLELLRAAYVGALLNTGMPGNNPSPLKKGNLAPCVSEYSSANGPLCVSVVSSQDPADETPGIL